MVSAAHQWLLLWLVRKMTADGFVVRGCDGPLPQGGLWNALPRALEANGIRPDAWGIAPETGAFAFAEAKTTVDVSTQHSQTQLRTIASFLDRGGPECRLYMAVPRSAAHSLDRALVDAGLVGNPRVVRMHIPDCFLQDLQNECA